MVIETNKRVFYSPRKALAFILEEVLLVSVIVYLTYKVLGIHIYEWGVDVFYTPALPQNILWLIALIVFYCFLYITIVRRDPLVGKMHKEFWPTLLKSLSEKKEVTSRHVVIMVFAEFVFVMMLPVAIFVYLDPDVNVLPADIPLWAKIVGFIAWIGFGVFIYSKTREFRRLVYGPSLVKRVLFKSHDLTETRRVTNTRTGSIRVASKHHYDRIKESRRSLHKKSSK